MAYPARFTSSKHFKRAIQTMASEAEASLHAANSRILSPSFPQPHTPVLASFIVAAESPLYVVNNMAISSYHSKTLSSLPFLCPCSNFQQGLNSAQHESVPIPWPNHCCQRQSIVPGKVTCPSQWSEDTVLLPEGQ